MKICRLLVPPPQIILQDPRRSPVQLPDFVALCEVENDSVLFDLTRRSALRGVNYDYVMTDSPDERGIDVALLYQPSSFALIQFLVYPHQAAAGYSPYERYSLCFGADYE